MFSYPAAMATKTIPWEVVEALLVKLKKSRDQFEKELSVEKSTISNWKNRGVPRGRAAEIAALLNTTTDHLLQIQTLLPESKPAIKAEPSGEFSLEWVSPKEKELLTLYRQTSKTGREFIFRTAHLERDASPSTQTVANDD